MGEQDPPNGWELSRSIKRVETQVGVGFDRMDQRFQAMDDRFVTRREHGDLKDDVDEIKARDAEREKWRRTASLTLAIAIIGWIVTIALALVAVVGT